MHCSTLSLKWMCLRSLGDCNPEDDDAEGGAAALPGVAGLEEVEWSETSRSSNGRLRPLVALPYCCARRASVACFINDDDEIERCSMTSDRLRFLRIGFLLTNELLRDRSLVAMEESLVKCLLFPVCSGPYSQVTSQSFNLGKN